MCRSAEALGRLTLPGGDSRTHAAVPRPEDLQLASSGGCIDIPPGARVTVRQAFRNTSVVTYGAADAPSLVVPNADFRPVGTSDATVPDGTVAAGNGVAPAGYTVAQRLPVAGPGSDALVVLEDRRLTPRLRERFWGNGGAETQLDEHDPLADEFHLHPLLNARLQLLSARGQVLGETREDYPLARIEPAPLHGLPVPTVLFTVDMSAGFGGFSGPATVLLTPTTQGLAPVQFVPERGGKPETLGLARTLHSGWSIVPACHGGTEELEEADCPGGGGAHLTLGTYRFHDGQWHLSERQGAECGDVEEMPPRSAFP